MNEHFVELGSYFSCDSGRSTYPIFDALTERRRVLVSHYHSSCQPNSHSCDLYHSRGINFPADTHGFCLFVSLFFSFLPFLSSLLFCFSTIDNDSRAFLSTICFFRRVRCGMGKRDTRNLSTTGTEWCKAFGPQWFIFCHSFVVTYNASGLLILSLLEMIEQDC